jgi:hypothetical protein
MRQNAVSSAPQNDDAKYTAATSAMIPVVVDASCRRRTTSISVDSAAVGKICSRSSSTEFSSSWERSTRAAMNSAISVIGRIDSRRLYATIAERPVTLSS